MNTVFPSKISWWLFGPIILVLLGSAAITVADGQILPLLILLLTLAFIGWLLRRTYYEVQPQQQTLRVVSGPMTWQVPIERITRIQDSRNPLAAPAASLDRLKISYNRYDEIVVSPRDKADFIAALQQLNPQIQVG